MCLIGKTHLLCMQCRGIGPHLVARGKSHGFSRISVLLAFDLSPLEMANKERTREINFFLILPFEQGPDPLVWPVSALSREGHISR